MYAFYMHHPSPLRAAGAPPPPPPPPQARPLLLPPPTPPGKARVVLTAAASPSPARLEGPTGKVPSLRRGGSPDTSRTSAAPAVGGRAGGGNGVVAEPHVVLLGPVATGLSRLGFTQF
jgi:hypothetical protein